MLIIILGGTTTSVVKMIVLTLSIVLTALALVSIGTWLSKKPWKGRNAMRKAVAQWSSMLSEASAQLAGITEEESAVRPSPEKWSKKQILGHMIDSASNNHQRFVRAQLSAELRDPGYDQNAWVQAQDYQHESWNDLILLWKHYNIHLLHVVKKISEEEWKTFCFIGDKEPVTLETIVTEYVHHFQHHLDQLLVP